MDTLVSSAEDAQVPAHPAVSAAFEPGSSFTWRRWEWTSSRQRNFGTVPLVSPVRSDVLRRSRRLT